MQLRCRYCEHTTVSEDEILEKLEKTIRDSIAENRSITTGFDCYNCEAPIIEIIINAQECIIEEDDEGEENGDDKEQTSKE